jgi:hypothetical protein
MDLGCKFMSGEQEIKYLAAKENKENKERPPVDFL